MASHVYDIRAWLRTVPAAREAAHRYRRLVHPVDLGNVRRTRPVSDIFGFDRGRPVGRYYTERFLRQHQEDIRGRVLEVKDSAYTIRYGHDVSQADVLDIDSSNPLATIVADLAQAGGLFSESFDCFILTQTLQYIYDLRAAISHAHRILRPGGVLLATLPTGGRIDPTSKVPEYWRFTAASCARLFGEIFGDGNVQVESHGNVLVCIASLLGMATEELSRKELETNDPMFPVEITVRAVRAAQQTAPAQTVDSG
jgi:SAM-dependent methyltransferase